MAENKHRKSSNKKNISKSKKKTQIEKQNEKEIKKGKKIKFKDKHPKAALIIKILIIIILILTVIGAGIFIGAIYGAFGDGRPGGTGGKLCGQPVQRDEAEAGRGPCPGAQSPPVNPGRTGGRP